MKDYVRGTKNMGDAQAFAHQFPIGTQFTATEFCQFAIQQGWLTDINDLNGRHQLKNRLNNGGACEELDVADRFQIAVLSRPREGNDSSVWTTMPLSDYASHRMETLPADTSRYFDNRIRQVNHLTESRDFDQLSPMIQRRLDDFRMLTERARRRVAFEMEESEREFNELKARARTEARKLLEQGVNLNGGLIGFLGIEALTDPDDAPTP